MYAWARASPTPTRTRPAGKHSTVRWLHAAGSVGWLAERGIPQEEDVIFFFAFRLGGRRSCMLQAGRQRAAPENGQWRLVCARREGGLFERSATQPIMNSTCAFLHEARWAGPLTSCHWAGGERAKKLLQTPSMKWPARDSTRGMWHTRDRSWPMVAHESPWEPMGAHGAGCPRRPLGGPWWPLVGAGFKSSLMLMRTPGDQSTSPACTPAHAHAHAHAGAGSSGEGEGSPLQKGLRLSSLPLQTTRAC